MKTQKLLDVVGGVLMGVGLGALVLLSHGCGTEQDTYLPDDPEAVYEEPAEPEVNGYSGQVADSPCSRTISPLCAITGGEGIFLIGDTCGTLVGVSHMNPSEVDLFCGWINKDPAALTARMPWEIPDLILNF